MIVINKMRNFDKGIEKNSLITDVLLESGGVKGHITYSLAHVITACILMIAGADDVEYAKYNKAAIVYTTVATTDVGQVLKLEFIGTWNIIQMCALFNFLTFGMHLFYLYMMLVKSEYYVSIKWRWLEYSVTAPLMLVNIAILSGIRDVFTLCTIAGAISATQYFGYLTDMCFKHGWMKTFNAESPFGVKFLWFNTKSPFWFGALPYAFAWAPVISSFRITTSKVEDLPDIVPWIIFIMLTFFSLFALVQWWMIVSITTDGEYDSILSDKDKVFQRYDGALHLLSLLSKITMAWMIYGGVTSMGDI